MRKKIQNFLIIFFVVLVLSGFNFQIRQAKADNILNLEDEIFENYQEKYMNTHFEFEKLKIEEFEKILSIKGVDFYRFIGDEKSKYLDFHKLSIKLLKNFKL